MGIAEPARGCSRERVKLGIRGGRRSAARLSPGTVRGVTSHGGADLACAATAGT